MSQFELVRALADRTPSPAAQRRLESMPVHCDAGLTHVVLDGGNARSKHGRVSDD